MIFPPSRTTSKTQHKQALPIVTQALTICHIHRNTTCLELMNIEVVIMKYVGIGQTKF